MVDNRALLSIAETYPIPILLRNRESRGGTEIPGVCELWIVNKLVILLLRRNLAVHLVGKTNLDYFKTKMECVIVVTVEVELPSQNVTSNIEVASDIEWPDFELMVSNNDHSLFLSVHVSFIELSPFFNISSAIVKMIICCNKPCVLRIY